MRKRLPKRRKNSALGSATKSGPRNRKNIPRARSACCARDMLPPPTKPRSILFWRLPAALPDCAAEKSFQRKTLMEIPKYKIALIVGAGAGLSASLARLLAREGIRVALAARHIEKLGALCTETGASAFACDATNPDDVERLFGLVEREIGTPDVVVYNASGRTGGV